MTLTRLLRSESPMAVAAEPSLASTSTRRRRGGAQTFGREWFRGSDLILYSLLASAISDRPFTAEHQLGRAGRGPAAATLLSRPVYTRSGRAHVPVAWHSRPTGWVLGTAAVVCRPHARAHGRMEAAYRLRPTGLACPRPDGQPGRALVAALGIVVVTGGTRRRRRRSSERSVTNISL